MSACLITDGRFTYKPGIRHKKSVLGASIRYTHACPKPTFFFKSGKSRRGYVADFPIPPNFCSIAFAQKYSRIGSKDVTTKNGNFCPPPPGGRSRGVPQVTGHQSVLTKVMFLVILRSKQMQGTSKIDIISLLGGQNISWIRRPPLCPLLYITFCHYFRVFPMSSLYVTG